MTGSARHISSLLLVPRLEEADDADAGNDWLESISILVVLVGS
jgi:hypothetical protein